MDIYAEVTNRIIDQMEQGIIPWQKPWIASGNAISRATGKPYSLLNQMILGRGGEYLTFAQCQKEGGKVRKGAKAQMVVFWKWIEQEDEETDEVKEIPFLCCSNKRFKYIVPRGGKVCRMAFCCKQIFSML